MWMLSSPFAHDFSYLEDVFFSQEPPPFCSPQVFFGKWFIFTSSFPGGIFSVCDVCSFDYLFYLFVLCGYALKYKSKE